jgi:hypothetical protein
VNSQSSLVAELRHVVVCTGNIIRIDYVTESPKRQRRRSRCSASFSPCLPHRSSEGADLRAENAALRHQLIVPQRRVSGRVQLTNGDPGGRNSAPRSNDLCRFGYRL